MKIKRVSDISKEDSSKETVEQIKKEDVKMEKKIQENSIANKIWSEIKDLPIEMFALPNQIINKYCKPVDINPQKLYLTITATAVLPALELAIGAKYSVERANKYIIVSYAEEEI